MFYHCLSFILFSFSSHPLLHRKFADIEAANHRLASALYLKDEETSVSSRSSQRPAIPDQSGSEGPVRCHADGISEDHVFVDPGDAGNGEKQQRHFGNVWKRPPKPPPGSSGDDRTQTLPEDFHKHPAEYDHELLKSTFDLWGDVLDVAAFTPELCDLAAQTLADSSSCPQTQRSIGDLGDTQWADIMDLFGSKDSGGCVDGDSYFEGFCACQGDAGGEDDGQTDDFMENICCGPSELEDVRLEERGQCRYERGRSRHGDQGSMVNHLQRDQTRSDEDAEETHGYLRPFQCMDVVPDQLSASISFVSEPQPYQQEGACLSLLGSNQNFPPFEGVAQSFCAPPHYPERRPIPTPPHEDDWLFTDILKDGK